MSEPTEPSTGARYLLELREARVDAGGTLASAHYRVTITAADAVYRAIAELRDDGSAELIEEALPAPADLRAQVLVFARLTARGAPSRRAEGLPEWPARVQRWRPRK